MVITLTELGELPVAAAAANERDAKRQAVRPDSAGHRQGRVVEQVDKVGVLAQTPVELDRIGLHGGHAVVCGRSGHHQQVHPRPQGISLLAEQLELGLCVKEVGRAELLAISNDAAHRLDDSGLVRVKKGPDGGVTLGHQRTAVEQLRRLLERRKVDVYWRAAHGLQALDGLGKCSFGLRVAKEFELVRHTKVKVRRQGAAGQRQSA